MAKAIKRRLCATASRCTRIAADQSEHAEFQAHTAAGKLNAVMMPTLPIGCHVSRMACCGRSDWIVRAVELAGQTDREVGDVDALLHFAEALLVDLAHLERDQFAERFLLVAQRHADAADVLATLRRRHFPPTQERFVSGFRRPIVFGLTGLAHRGDPFAGRRAVRDQLGAGALEPLADVGARVDVVDAELSQKVHRHWVGSVGFVSWCVVRRADHRS